MDLSSFQYYQTIEYTGCDQDVYQQDVIVHRIVGDPYVEIAGCLNIWHIYTGDHCKEDYGDIRFTDGMGTELAYYIWPDYTTTSAKFCVRLEDADRDGTLVIWYGDPVAETTSDADAVYLLFDHFDGAANATPNAEIWEVVKKGSVSATVKLDGNGNLLLAGQPNVISSGNLWAKIPFGRDVIIEYRDKVSDKHYPDTSYGKGGVGGVFDPESNSWWHTGLYEAYAIRVQEGNATSASWVDKTDISTDENIQLGKSTSPIYPLLNTYYIHKFVIGELDLKVYRDDMLIISASDTTYTGDGFRLLLTQGEYIDGRGGIRTIDYALIRAYSPTPPSANIFTGERRTTYFRRRPSVLFGSTSMMIV